MRQCASWRYIKIVHVTKLDGLAGELVNVRIEVLAHLYLYINGIICD